MITNVTPFSPEFIPFFPEEYAGKRALYFDIETTGLSAQTSYVYLIGCAYREEEGFTLTQWLCTEPAEEKELLRLFFEKAADFEVLLHYNGTGFDLPFLEKKAKRHRLSNPLPLLESLDLYNTSRALKPWFDLPNLKLKTMERFFGFSRTDVFSGEDLISVYAQFLGLHRLNTLTNNQKQNEEHALTHVLLLHNAEDVKNLPSLTVLFFLKNLSSFFKETTLLPVSFTPAAEVFASDTEFLSLSYTLPCPPAKDFSFSFPWETSAVRLFFSAEQSTVSLFLPVYHGELKYFYPNPADYYYLPMEDCAMHKSIASFVEKEYRQKATAATCYSKKAGGFLPLGICSAKGTKSSDPAPAVSEQTKRSENETLAPGAAAPRKKEAQKEACASLPCFLSGYKSKYGYTPLTKELLESPRLLTFLCKQLLSTLF
ncbi:MAG: ribonuclease H-like domain-containing protein [Lachnospiraceae bacterium]|nr:ribonuclease H-like domain-containing protein [Lachnospiraceae bacterium]